MFRKIARKLNEKSSLAGLAMIFSAVATGTWLDPVAISQAIAGLALIAQPEGSKYQ